VVGDEGFEPYRNISHAFVKTAQTPRKHSSKCYFDGFYQKRLYHLFAKLYCQELSGILGWVRGVKIEITKSSALAHRLHDNFQEGLKKIANPSV
jgi:hypothetical protein